MPRKKAEHPAPADIEIRIRRDGRVYVVAGDEAAFDLAEAIDPAHPALARRRRERALRGSTRARKAKHGGETRRRKSRRKR